MAAPSPVTQLLVEWRGGNEESLGDLMPLVYEELKRLAGSYMRSERPDHTLQATSLVHEAFVRLVNADVSYNDRAHFFAVAAQMMRRVLVDHAKAKRRQKRGGGVANVTLDEAIAVGSMDTAAETLIEVDAALTKLAGLDERKAKLVELFYFGGLTYKEAAEVMAISEATVHRDLQFAKAWLYNEMQPAAKEDA